MKSYRSTVGLTLGLLIAGFGLSGCATEKYVDEHIAAVNTRIDGVDSKVEALNGQVGALNGQVATLNGRMDHAEAAMSTTTRFAYAAGDQTSVDFATNKWNLSPEAQTTLTALADKLKSDNKNVFIEIIGHADPRGELVKNRELGAKRALNVQRFLYDQGIPLARMNAVSWGEEKVANPKDRSPEALQKSRRVDVVVRG
jgi:outer membrane protein OmpA-like peptidoglycan-associated protein